jgi:hypothetical protein
MVAAVLAVWIFACVFLLVNAIGLIVWDFFDL